MGDDLYGDFEAQKTVQFLDVSLLMTSRDRLEPLNWVLGPPPKPSIEEEPNMEIENTTVPPQVRILR